MTKITVSIPAKKVKVNHKVGNYYMRGADIYILVYTAGGHVAEASLINIASGYRWRDSVVIDDSRKLTDAEWVQLSGADSVAGGDQFELVESLDISVAWR